MSIVIYLVIAVVFLAYANGANDNFKGVATLFGSDTANYRRSLGWATVTTLAGSLTSFFLAEALVSRFSGKGLIPDILIGSPEFLLAVAIGAGATVLLATFIGFPISTTHSLIGALTGSGLMAAGSAFHGQVLLSKFFWPLLVSPFLAALSAGLLYRLLRYTRLRMNLTKESIAYISGPENFQLFSSRRGAPGMERSRLAGDIPGAHSAATVYTGTVWGFPLQSLLDKAHYLSAGAVGFARGLNDTPKIVALLVGVQALQIRHGLLLTALAMALGGILNSGKVARTISKDITPMNPGQGFTANITTAFLVIVASRWGMPVSTTHVSVGALFGIGAATGEIHKRKSRDIFFSWVLTLPIAAVISAVVYLLLNG